MAPVKFVIKCGNFAVLVDLHVLPLGGGEDASWFTTDHIEEVTALVRDAVDQRVKQYAESLHSRRHHKQKKELAPASALFVEGTNFKLVANFLKRHVNLRCIAKQLYGDLRVFPERYVVCVSCPEDASAHHGNLSLATTEQCEQSRSEYFSRVGETQEPFSSPTITKKTALQKIAKQAAVQPGHHGSCATAEQEQEQETGQRACLKKQSQEHRNGEPRALRESASSSAPKAPSRTEHELNLPSSSNGAAAKTVCTQKPKAEKSAPDSLNPNGASLVFRKYEINQGIGKRCKPSDVGEDPHPQKAKRTCLGGPPATVRTRSAEPSTKTSSDVYLPLTPPAPVEANAESKAFPVWESKKTTVEVELLTLGKRAQRLPPHKQ